MHLQPWRGRSPRGGVDAPDQARLRTENAVAAATLERDLVEKQTAARYGLARKFRSYDMWRARALLESARRMAVAARRAIEASFVVDLSSLQAQQAFVEAPAVWADEVYATDLDAPSVVGLSVAPDLDDAIYPNQLLDYVGNLERFVQGYTVSYPTSVASPDTEVITLPGPELTEEVTQVLETTEEVQELPVEVLSGDALGWTFSAQTMISGCLILAPARCRSRIAWPRSATARRLRACATTSRSTPGPGSTTASATARSSSGTTCGGDALPST